MATIFVTTTARMVQGPQEGRFRATIRGVIPAIVTGLFVLVVATYIIPFGAASLASGETVGASILLVLGQWVVYLVAIPVALWLAFRLDQGSLSRFGLGINRAWLINLGAGFVISLLVSVVYFMYGVWRGHFTVHPVRATAFGEVPIEAVVIVFCSALVALFLANIWEEIVFRGIMLQNFVEGLHARGYSPNWAIGGAIIAHALLFGLYHIPEFFVLAWYTSFLGIIFAVAYLVTGSLGLAVGVHFGRFPIELLVGEDLGAVQIPTIVEIGVLPLSASIEMLTLEFGLSCGLILAWAFFVNGEISVADRIYEPPSSE